MPIAISCPFCRGELIVAESISTISIPCPDCGTTLFPHHQIGPVDESALPASVADADAAWRPSAHSAPSGRSSDGGRLVQRIALGLFVVTTLGKCILTHEVDEVAAELEGRQVEREQAEAAAGRPQPAPQMNGGPVVRPAARPVVRPAPSKERRNRI